MMKNLQIGLILLLAFSTMAMRSDIKAYELYNEKGKSVKYKKLIKDALNADIILFGELHNNPISHWMQLELTKDLYSEIGEDLILAAEMFETDNQMLLDEYISGLIRQRNFEDEVKLWNNYSTDYKPLVEFAKENNLTFVAANIPRRYASMVHRGGFEALDELSAEAKSLLPPLPVAYDPELPGYKAMIEMMSGMGAGHANPNLPKAQAIKDATMAHFIMKYFEPGKTVLHFNGAYHSDNFEGIYWYLKLNNPELKILTISTVEQDDVDTLSEENTGIANYVINVPATMTKTY
jgi:uncharacterized iron-regulated protein